MSRPPPLVCPTCQYKWECGESGWHSCKDNLRHQRDDAWDALLVLAAQLTVTRDLVRELASRIEQILLCKSGPHGWVVGNLRLAAKQAEGSMIKAKEVLP